MTAALGYWILAGVIVCFYVLPITYGLMRDAFWFIPATILSILLGLAVFLINV